MANDLSPERREWNIEKAQEVPVEKNPFALAVEQMRDAAVMLATYECDNEQFMNMDKIIQHRKNYRATRAEVARLKAEVKRGAKASAARGWNRFVKWYKRDTIKKAGEK